MSCACGQQCGCQKENAKLARALELIAEASDLRREADRANEQAMLAVRSALHVTGGEQERGDG